MPYNKDERRTTTTTSRVGAQTESYPKAAKTGKLIAGGCLGMFFIILAAAGVLIWFIFSLLRAEDSSTMEGKALYFTHQGVPMVASVVSYFRATQVEKTGGSTIRRGSTTYWLIVHALPGGEVVGKTKLNDVWEALNPSHINLLGYDNEHILIQAGTPLRFTVEGLQPADLEDYAGGGLMPSEARYYLPDEANHAVWIDLKDGRKAWMDTRTGRIEVLPHPEAPAQPDGDALRQIRRNRNANERGFTGYVTWGHATAEGRLHLLLPEGVPAKSFDADKLGEFFYRDNERVYLFRTGYSTDARNNYLVPDDAGKIQLEQKGFLQGGLLKDVAGEGPLFHNNNYLVLYRSLVGKDGFMYLTSINPEGRPAWDIEICPADEVKQIFSINDWLYVIAPARLKKGNRGGDEVIGIHLDKGIASRFNLYPK